MRAAASVAAARRVGWDMSAAGCRDGGRSPVTWRVRLPAPASARQEERHEVRASDLAQALLVAERQRGLRHEDEAEGDADEQLGGHVDVGRAVEDARALREPQAVGEERDGGGERAGAKDGL